MGRASISRSLSSSLGASSTSLRFTTESSSNRISTTLASTSGTGVEQHNWEQQHEYDSHE
eukprot:374162-Pyramimonas_sp.AAC.1